MHLQFVCPSCQAGNQTEVNASTASLECGDCHWSRAVAADEVAESRPTKCLVCGCQDLWKQKDFPQRLGVMMVATGAILSTIAWAQYRPALALGVLLGFALVDLLLYVFMNDVLVCYRCQARLRKTSPDFEYPRFDLETAERYRQEAARIAASSPAGPRPPAVSPQ